MGLATILIDTILVIALLMSFVFGFCLGWRFAVKRIFSENKDLSAVVEN